MEITRKINLETNLGHANFKVGDTFTFKMADGEKVGVIAVKEDANGNMLFIFDNCLKDKYTMNEILNDGVLKKIYNRFPKEIKERMIAFSNKDYLRLPTEKEIFGVNKYGETESVDVTQFECMKRREYRIAFRGYGSDAWKWYWLANRHKFYACNFVLVGDFGGFGCGIASSGLGIRLIFMLNNNQQIEVANGKDNAYESDYMEYMKKEYDKVINEFEQTKETVIQEIKDMTAFNAVEFGAAYASRIDRITKAATKLQTINELMDTYKYFENKRCIS